MRIRRVLLPLFIVLTLLGAACGSTSYEDVVSDDGADARSAPASTEAPGGDPGGEPADDTSADGGEDSGPSSDDAGSDQGADDGAGEVDPDATRVEQAALSTQDESYRAEMFMVMSMGAEGFAFNMGSDSVPVATVAYDGDETGMEMDLSVLLGDLFGSLGGLFDDPELGGFDFGDLEMDMVMTDDTMYLHSPFLGAPGAASAETWMQAAADGWISISIAGLTSSEALADFGEISGLGSTAGVDQFFDLLDQVDDVEPLGPSVIRGVDVEGYRVTVSMEELMALQGASAEELLGPEFVDLFEDFEYAFDAYLGADDGRLYAVDVVMDESLFESFGDQLGEEMPSDFAFEMSMRLEIFDHGSDDIDVVVPFGAVDVTDEFLSAGALGELDLTG